RKVAERETDYSHLGPGDLAHEIDKLEKQMLEHARNLEFEQAAALRDQISRLRERFMAV
ncbi:MAG: UvrB/UvrC motif-containing protein, partial [Alcanivoracaceae bacterium]|nr:UvrB/UvrC motif-containing protein [Alcanivoracaceae bacterium]